MPDTYLSLHHDWQKNITYKKSWKTSILTSSTGKEQRSALYTWPRRSIRGVSHHMSYQESARIKRKIYKYMHTIWGVPLWQDVAYLTAGAGSGQAVINVNTTNYTNFAQQTHCILINDDGDYEIIEISTLTDTVIIAVSNLAAAWPAGTKIYPVFNARLAGRQRQRASTSLTGTLNIEAAEVFELNNDNPVYTEPPPVFPQYSGKYMFNIKPDWAREPAQSLNRATEILQFLGYGCSETRTDEPVIRFDFDFVCINRQEIDEIITFFDYCKGRLKSFWVPTWQNDILVTAPISVNDTNVTIEDIEYPGHWLNNEMFGRYLYFQMPGGNISTKKVISSPDSTTITLDAGMEYACLQNQLSGLSVSFLSLARFAVDEIQCKYSTSTSARITASIQTVRDTLL